MQVKNKETGAVEAMRHGPATDAVSAGTHVFVSLDDRGRPRPADAKAGTTVVGSVGLDGMTRDELVAEAGVRGVTVKTSDSKADIIKALEAK